MSGTTTDVEEMGILGQAREQDANDRSDAKFEVAVHRVDERFLVNAATQASKSNARTGAV